MNIPQISNAEYDVMKIIWDNAPISTNDVVEKLSDSSWNPKTIQTMLLRLTKKGAITYEKKGRIYIYSPLIQKDDYIANKRQSFLDRFFDGNIHDMVLSFLQDDKLTTNDIEELRKILSDETDR